MKTVPICVGLRDPFGRVHIILAPSLAAFVNLVQTRARTYRNASRPFIQPGYPSIYLSIRPSRLTGIHPAIPPSSHPLSAFRAIFLHGAEQRLLFVPAAHQFNCTLVAPAMSDKRS